MKNCTHKDKKKFKVAIATGGTGGHIFPALAFVEMLKKDGQAHFILADERFLNFKSQFPKDLNYKIIFSSALAEYGFLKILGAIKILYGSLQALFSMLLAKPDLLVSFGGYPSFPAMLAATLLRVPLLIHEPNSIVGRASKFFLRTAMAVSVSFKGTKGVEKINHKKLFYTGTPIRREILDARKKNYPSINLKSKIHILILGGSQGARIFSSVIPLAVFTLKEKLKKRLCIHQQCRAENFRELNLLYKENKIQAEVKIFFDNMGHEFSKAHLIISRSGALTVSELIAVGRPSILVPFPFAMDNHQFFNAKELKKSKAAEIILEEEFTPKKLTNNLQNILSKPSFLKVSANNAKKMFNNWNNSFYDLVKTCVQKRKSCDKFIK